MNKFKLQNTPSLVFAFNAGPTGIIIFNSGKSPSLNAAFLERESNTTKQIWKIVVNTTPLYTSQSVHNADDADRISSTTVR